MANFIYQHIQQMARWWVIVLLFALSLICRAGFELRYWALKTEAVRTHAQVNDDDLRVPDVRWRGYGPDELGAYFTLIGRNGRELFIQTQKTLDLAFPFIYCLLLASLLVSLYPWERMRWIVFLPLIAAAFDLAENASNIYLASVFVEGQPARDFARVASAFTTAKCAGLMACLIAVAVGLVAKIYLWLAPSSGS